MHRLIVLGLHILFQVIRHIRLTETTRTSPGLLLHLWMIHMFNINIALIDSVDSYYLGFYSLSGHLLVDGCWKLRGNRTALHTEHIWYWIFSIEQLLAGCCFFLKRTNHLVFLVCNLHIYKQYETSDTECWCQGEHSERKPKWRLK